MAEKLASLRKKGKTGGYDFYDLGALSAGTPQVVNVSSIIPNYTKLTNSNFYLSATGLYSNRAVNISYSISYNASNGAVTISRGSNGYLYGRLIAIVAR